MENKYPKFFKKAIKGKVGGRFLNKKGDIEDFLLQGDPSSTIDTIFIEIYDEEAEKFFIKHNGKTITNGYLIAVSDYSLSIDSTNSASDNSLIDILRLSVPKLKIKLSEFTSRVPVQRILDLAKSSNKPVKTITLIESRLKELNN
jgi:hypothetical protein